MKKRFNTTGICLPDRHYMMDNSRQLGEIMEMVEHGEYFTINRPRQFGKTTTLQFIMQQLEKLGAYLPIAMNFQGVDSKWHENDAAFAEMFVTELHSFF